MTRVVLRSGRSIDYLVATGSTRSDVQCGMRCSQSVSLAQYIQSSIFTHGAVLIAAPASLHAEYDQIGKIDLSSLCFEPLSLPVYVDRLPSWQRH